MLPDVKNSYITETAEYCKILLSPNGKSTLKTNTVDKSVSLAFVSHFKKPV
jgi:hypothetical protein